MQQDVCHTATVTEQVGGGRPLLEADIIQDEGRCRSQPRHMHFSAAAIDHCDPHRHD